MRLRRERGQSFGAVHLIDILRGKRTEKIEQWGHDELSTFGIGDELTEMQWRAVIRQLLAGGYLSVSDRHSTLELTDASWGAMRGEQQLWMREQPIMEAPRSRRSRAEAGEKRSRPATLEELAEVSGVGKAKLERYGDQVLEIVEMDADADR